VPGIASAPPAVSRDGRTYTYTIRHGLTFSDGSPVEPADVVDTYLRNLSPKAGFLARDLGYFDDIAGAAAYETGAARRITGIRTTGDRVTFRLSRPDPTFPMKTAMRIMCIAPRGLPRAHQPTPPPTTGPFVITSHDPGRRLVLEQNPAWSQNAAIIGEPSPR